MGLTDNDPLASSETVSFDNDRNSEAAKFLANLVERSTDRVRSRRNVMPLHELLGKGLAGLELRRSLRRPEDAEATFGQLVDEPNEEREFRTDYSKCRLLNRDDVDHLVEIALIDRNAAGELRDTAIAGSAEDLCDLS
jgi:hypothetical protein